MQTQYFGGLDAHVAYVQVAVVDKSGQVHLEVRVATTEPETLVAALAPFRPLEVVVESSPFWAWVYDLLTPAGIRVHVAHARELRAIATSPRKTDRRDARLLAQMLASGLIPEVYPKSTAQREALTLLRHRQGLVRWRTALANRVHAQLHQQRLALPRGQVLRVQTRRWLREVAWPRLTPEQRRLVRDHLRLARRLTRMIRALDADITARAAADPAAIVLQTIPGIGPVWSLLLATELSPITRFPSAMHLVSYAGLAPTTRSSGGHTTRGSIPMGANRGVRGALISAIPTHVRCAPESALSAYYARQKGRLGWPKARVATARHLGHIVYQMLRTGEAFHP